MSRKVFESLSILSLAAFLLTTVFALCALARGEHLSAVPSIPVEALLRSSLGQPEQSFAMAGTNTGRVQTQGVELGPDHTGQGESGETIIYHHTLTNTGTTTDTYLVEVVSKLDWPVELLGGPYPTGTLMLPLRVGSQMTVSFQVSLTVPVTASGVTEITIVTATSQLSPTVQDTALDTTVVYAWVYLPFVAKRWPPVPFAPTLYPIDNVEGYGYYTVTWFLADPPDFYSLEEDDNSHFSSPTDVYSGTETSWRVPDDKEREPGAFYYRVRGHNDYGYGEYSNVERVEVPTLWRHDRECEKHPYEYTVGRPIWRYNACGEKVHGEFGCKSAEPWPAKPGYVMYTGISIPRADHLYVRLRYSKDSSSIEPIDIYVDDEPTARASFYPEDQKGWTKFAWTPLIDLGSIGAGTHSIKFETKYGQRYGVANLDCFTLANHAVKDLRCPPDP
jgi:hypothetical protein